MKLNHLMHAFALLAVFASGPQNSLRGMEQDGAYVSWRLAVDKGQTSLLLVDFPEKRASIVLEGLSSEHLLGIQVDFSKDPSFAHHVDFDYGHLLVFDGSRICFRELETKPTSLWVNLFLVGLELGEPLDSRQVQEGCATSWGLSMDLLEHYFKANDLESALEFLALHLQVNKRYAAERMTPWHAFLFRKLRMHPVDKVQVRALERLAEEDIVGSRQRDFEYEILMALWTEDPERLSAAMQSDESPSIRWPGPLRESIFYLLAKKSPKAALDLFDSSDFFHQIGGEEEQASLGLFEGRDSALKSMQWKTNKLLSTAISCYLRVSGNEDLGIRLLGQIQPGERRQRVLFMTASHYSAWIGSKENESLAWRSLAEECQLDESGQVMLMEYLSLPPMSIE
jgi:hypothetical protein